MLRNLQTCDFWVPGEIVAGRPPWDEIIYPKQEQFPCDGNQGGLLPECKQSSQGKSSYLLSHKETSGAM